MATDRRFAAGLAAAALTAAGLTFAPATAQAVTTTQSREVSEHRPGAFANCTALNRRFRHGVGKRGARDRTSGDPVTDFKRSNKIYASAMRKNDDMDRDKDKIACESH